MIAGLRVAEILAGVRGQPPCDAGALAAAIAAFSAWSPTWGSTSTPSTSTR